MQHTIIAGICTINTVCTVNTVNRNYAVISDHQDNYVYVVISEKKGKKKFKFKTLEGDISLILLSYVCESLLRSDERCRGVS